MILSDKFLKLKRIKGMHMLYVFPLLMCFIQVYEIMKSSSLNDGSVFNTPFSNVYFQLYSLFSSFAAMLLVFTIIQVENRNNMWESNFMLPISRLHVYLKKVIVCSIVLFSFVLISYLFYLLGIYVCKFFYDIPFTFSDNVLLILFFSKIFFAFILYAFIAIPLFVLIDSPVTSIGILSFFLFLSMFFFQKEWFMYYPFSYYLIAQRDLSFGKWTGIDTADIIVIVYIVISIVIGAMLFKKFKK